MRTSSFTNKSIDGDALDFDEFERNDDEGLGGSESGRRFRGMRAFVAGTTLTPLRNPSRWRAVGSSSPLLRAQGRSCPRSRSQRSKEISSREQPERDGDTYNLVARLGASSKRGGTRPKCHPTRKLQDPSTRGKRAKQDLGRVVQTCKPG